MATEQVRFTRPTSSGENIVHPETDSDQVIGFETAVKNVIDANLLRIVAHDEYFYRTKMFTSAKTSITIPKGLQVVVNGVYYRTTADTKVNIPSNITAANRAGKDLYVYACTPSSSQIAPTFVISDNSTYPSGYTATNSRKIGGFHCLCVAVGTIADHPLSGYVAGDILPASCWDLMHRPQSESEGMVYDEKLNIWVDIYLAHAEGTNLVSSKGQAIADGASSEKFHWYKFVQWFARTKKRLPFQYEFMQFSLGSNQGTNISGSKDAGSTNGHTDTAGRRMISDIGCEDCCGVMWQFALDRGGENTNGNWNDGIIGTTTGASWTPTYRTTTDENENTVIDTSIESTAYGQQYAAPFVALLGGNWYHGALCGSRASIWFDGPLVLNSHIGARGVSSPRIV